MPVAMPTWRKVELIPEPMPARCGGTTPTAVEASGGLMSADADAGEEEPGQQHGPCRVGVEPAHEQQPDADEQQPAADQSPHRHARGQLARDRRDEERQQRERQEAQPGLAAASSPSAFWM